MLEKACYIFYLLQTIFELVKFRLKKQIVYFKMAKTAKQVPIQYYITFILMIKFKIKNTAAALRRAVNKLVSNRI